MTTIPFCKFQGFGNDYIVIEKPGLAGVSALTEFAKDICDRHRGAGADGISVLEKLDGESADYFCEIVNPDGSIAGFSGNGTRCAVSYVYYKGLWSAEKLRLKTRSGVKNYRLIKRSRPAITFSKLRSASRDFRPPRYHSRAPSRLNRSSIAKLWW